MISSLQLLLVLLVVVLSQSSLIEFNNQGCCPFLIEIGERKGITLREKVYDQAIIIGDKVNNKINHYIKADVIANELDIFREDFVTTINNAKNHVKASTLAKATSIFILHPLDTVKSRMQLSPHLKTALLPLSVSNMYRGIKL